MVQEETDYVRLRALREQGLLTDEEFRAATSAVAAPADAGTTAVPPMPPARMHEGGYLTGQQPPTRDDLRAGGLRFKAYPVWLMVLLSVITWGLFAWFWVNHWHGVMPKRRPDDPSTARAIGFMFIPLFNLYWMFESRLRLCTRLDEELDAAGIRARCPRELIRWWSILDVIPYLGLLVMPLLAAIAVGMLQSRVNALARYDDSLMNAPR
ncbi:MAG: DUF4234 domain-containing protein [Tepidiformaceae bacterium]